MLRRWALSLILGVAIFGVIAWAMGIFPYESITQSFTPLSGAARAPEPEKKYGDPLYQVAGPITDGEEAKYVEAEPIVIPDCHIAAKHAQVLSSLREGHLLVIGTEVSKEAFDKLPEEDREKLFVQEKDQEVLRYYR